MWGIAQIILLSLLAQTLVCSAAMVLYCGGIFPSGLYCVLHFASLWFRMCRRSITFTTFNHTWLKGFWNGSSHLAIFSPSTWHILSYATIVCDILFRTSFKGSPSSRSSLNFLYSQRISTRNACVGDSDLHKKETKKTQLCPCAD